MLIQSKHENSFFIHTPKTDVCLANFSSACIIFVAIVPIVYMFTGVSPVVLKAVRVGCPEGVVTTASASSQLRQRHGWSVCVG